jgi:Protein of unknown function (DUF2752)
MIIVFANIITWLQQHQLPCLFKSTFHFDCPGCGFQRSCIALLGGNFFESIKFYPATILIFLFFLYLFLNARLQLKFSRIINQISIASIFIVILVNYIYKLAI